MLPPLAVPTVSALDTPSWILQLRSKASEAIDGNDVIQKLLESWFDLYKSRWKTTKEVSTQLNSVTPEDHLERRADKTLQKVLALRLSALPVAHSFGDVSLVSTWRLSLFLSRVRNVVVGRLKAEYKDAERGSARLWRVVSVPEGAVVT